MSWEYKFYYLWVSFQGILQEWDWMPSLRESCFNGLLQHGQRIEDGEGHGEGDQLSFRTKYCVLLGRIKCLSIT